ncbi:type II toxin-antitoxin system VapC family toxin [Rhodopseudomonas palustris]|uniref:type II toxin-antitoxin system VapC family toxin n=1 Tax=Rhodopseudomonas palustris TaxID=1076 RepID=UPI0020CF2D56|nr:type II toxin-antitoxin system VapC family toxin [Rhodopseudomonas palustris]MCP9629471.1 type II toxin-antitoxin system VapC family toxin [Rhodopseudomonas palustris]
MICLDTNVVIEAINRRTPVVARRLGEALSQGVKVSLPVIALCELRYGYARSDRRAKMDALLEEFLSVGIAVLPFEANDANHAGEIRAGLERLGQPIGLYDYLIAAQARARGATLVTANRREFERVPGLMVTDWTA